LPKVRASPLLLLTSTRHSREFAEDPEARIPLKTNDSDRKIVLKHFKTATAESFDSHHVGRSMSVGWFSRTAEGKEKSIGAQA